MIRRPLTTISLKQSDVEQMTDFLKPKVKIVSIEGTVSQKVITAKNLLSKASPTLKTLTATSSLLFQLFAHYHSVQNEKETMLLKGMPLTCYSHLHILDLFVSSCETYHSTSLGRDILWRLNPIAVISKMCSQIIISISEMFGQSIGRFAASLFSQLPLIAQLPALLIFTICLLSSLFMIAGYSFSLTYWSVTIRPKNSSCEASKIISERIFDSSKPLPNLPRDHDNSRNKSSQYFSLSHLNQIYEKVDEFYQKKDVHK